MKQVYEEEKKQTFLEGQVVMKVGAKAEVSRMEDKPTGLGAMDLRVLMYGWLTKAWESSDSNYEGRKRRILTQGEGFIYTSLVASGLPYLLRKLSFCYQGRDEPGIPANIPLPRAVQWLKIREMAHEDWNTGLIYRKIVK